MFLLNSRFCFDGVDDLGDNFAGHSAGKGFFVSFLEFEFFLVFEHIAYKDFSDLKISFHFFEEDLVVKQAVLLGLDYGLGFWRFNGVF